VDWARLPDDLPVPARRRRQPLARMAVADPALEAVYAYWRSRCDSGLLPRRAQVDVARLIPAAGHLAVVHVAGSTARDYAAADWASVAWLGAPLYEDVGHRTSAAPGYGRLVLPLTEDGRQVSALAVCSSETPHAAARTSGI
jgi:hypothetical protein